MSRVRITSFLIAAALLATAAFTTSSVLARQPDKEQHYVSKDYRIYMPHPKDQQGWRELTIDEEKEERTVLKLMYKRPDSTNNYDVVMIMGGYDHNLTITYTDPETAEQSKMGAANISKIAEAEAAGVERGFKVIKDQTRLRKQAISRDAGKGYYFSFSGTIDKEPLPQHRECYVFKANQKTYILHLRMPLSTTKDRQTMKTVQRMIRSMRCWKP